MRHRRCLFDGGSLDTCCIPAKAPSQRCCCRRGSGRRSGSNSPREVEESDDDERNQDDDRTRKIYTNFRNTNFIRLEILKLEMSGPYGGIMTECGSDPLVQHVLLAEDAECCICSSPYDNGVELRELPCGHHFHRTSI